MFFLVELTRADDGEEIPKKNPKTTTKHRNHYSPVSLILRDGLSVRGKVISPYAKF